MDDNDVQEIRETTMDMDFAVSLSGLHRAVDLLATDHEVHMPEFSSEMPTLGVGSSAALELLAPYALAGASRLGAETALAHMDPPTPWISWATTLWNAALNQNLLHPATAPVAREIEERVIGWLAPFFGMQGGHMTPGSTVANLTGLWAAREIAGITEVVAGEGAHLSVAKSAHLLGLRYRTVPSSALGTMRADALDGDLRRTALVLTAGTTSTGAVDPLSLTGRAAWTHIDAAWAGPLRLSPTYAMKLDGIERADSLAISPHKWLFQPKEAGLVLFRDVKASHAAISFGGTYLTAPNIGLLGSRGATAIPLLATILAWGRSGLAERVERCMALAYALAAFIAGDARLELLTEPQTGIVVWRPRNPVQVGEFYNHLTKGVASLTTLGGEAWLRNVAANPNANIEALISAIRSALDALV
jgi:L-2,4-diaminobutyrate decarboxylase